MLRICGRRKKKLTTSTFTYVANIYCNAYTATEDVVGLTYQLTHNSETNIDDELHRSQTLTYDINLDLVKVVRRVDSKHEALRSDHAPSERVEYKYSLKQEYQNWCS